METKEGKNKKNKQGVTVKTFLILLSSFVVVLYCIQVFVMYFKAYGKEELKEAQSEPTKEISEAKKIDIDEIIKKNSGEDKQEEIEKHEEELEYLTTYKINKDLPKDEIHVIQEGRTGKQEIVTKKTYEKGELVSEEQISAKVTKASMNKVVEVGGANYASKHTVKVGDTVYITAEIAAVMFEPNEASQKMASIPKDTAVKVNAIQEGWYNISSNEVVGWVKSESTTSIDPNSKYEPEGNSQSGSKEKSKKELMSKLNKNMKLNEPSGLSLNQFKKVLTDSKDTKKVMINNAQYFYYIESQYKINGVFVASMAIHESAWGTSKIANDKKNLFGYGAYDSGPYNGAYNFSEYSECIDLIARVLVKHYLNPSGTKIYGNEVATGKYYSTPTLEGVNSKYASDKGWANKVFQYMQYLYEKL